ncbi:MAG TPA: hypothetical protein ENN20_03475 [Candidatus Marinimicrobia bacterium]|nr:hypothetical protein [Candidatus Neomarinimicrobiota bacterium]
MRSKILFLCLLTLGIFGLQAQQINVTGTVIIPTEESRYMAPQFSPDGEKILFTEFGYKGLWLYDLKEKSLTQLNDYPGAGYEPVFTADGERIVFRVDEYRDNRKYSSLAIQAIGEKKANFMIRNVRRLSPPALLKNRSLVYRKNSEVCVYNFESKMETQSVTVQGIYGYVENQKIILIQNGTRQELAPLPSRNYIWFSLSPDNTKMVFTVVGGDTYVTDIAGNILKVIEKANAPQWSPDGKWILFMVDEDDGHVITASEIWAYHLEKNRKIQITATEDIHEMYPVWSPRRDQIAYHTDDGKIMIASVRVED